MDKQIAIFARRDHPEGWGYPVVTWDDEKGEFISANPPKGKAHGYVVIAVRCTEDQLQDIRDKLFNNFSGLDGAQYGQGALDPNGYQWFGGGFDYLGSVNGDQFNMVSGDHPFQCLGDNRFVGLYEAKEVLEASQRVIAP